MLFSHCLQGYSSLRFRPIRTLSSAVENLRRCKVVGVIDKVMTRPGTGGVRLGLDRSVSWMALAAGVGVLGPCTPTKQHEGIHPHYSHQGKLAGKDARPFRS